MNSPRAVRRMAMSAAFVLTASSAFAAPQGMFAFPADVPATNPALVASRWPAQWIAPPGGSLTDYGVFLFRKKITLASKPEKFVVHISADNRYRLFVNGESLTYGPQRGDLMRWHYDSLDLAPYLQAGENLIAVQVWNFGEERPFALMSLRTGLILQGDGPAEQIVNTGDGWRVFVDRAFAPLSTWREALHTFIVVGPGEQFDAMAHPWGWEKSQFDDASWTGARAMEHGFPANYGTDITRWLAPRTIPPMEEKQQRFSTVRRTIGANAPNAVFILTGRSPWIVPPNSSARVLLDQGFETNAFPQLIVSGGRGARVILAYAEALFDASGAKGNRDEIDGRELRGVEDRFLPDGGSKRVFTTLDYRTWRYVELRVETATEPLTIDEIRSVATGYPFLENGSFTSDDSSLTRIWDVGWRTARLCAGETYMDCPYYERLQYVGDTRIQALISLYVSGDDRLMRNAIELYDRSRIPEGLTQSRYPSNIPQIINTFSLFWIGMVHDHWMHRDDPAFIENRLRGVESVLAWFDERVDAKTGMLGALPFWTFVDWPDQWPWKPAQDVGGEPPGARTVGSSIVSMQYAMALDQAAELARAFGRGERAAGYSRRANSLRVATMRACWDDTRHMLADTAEKRDFSQHANAVAILSGAVRGDDARDLITRVIADKSIVQCTVYFRFYLLRALKATGLGDQYLEELGPWHDMLALGLSTFAERPEPTRSDCHAWSASPVYEFLATVCGIEPGSPGFKTVRIEPHLGKLTHAEGTVPHQSGLIRVKLTRDGTKLHARVELPANLAGEFVWGGRTIQILPGSQDLEF